MRKLLLVVAVLSMAACSSPTAPGVPPIIRSFTADAQVIAFGSSTVLRWEVSGSETQDLSATGAVLPVDTCAVQPIRSTTYTLTARNSAGEVTRSVTVSVAAVRPALPGQ